MSDGISILTAEALAKVMSEIRWRDMAYEGHKTITVAATIVFALEDTEPTISVVMESQPSDSVAVTVETLARAIADDSELPAVDSEDRAYAERLFARLVYRTTGHEDADAAIPELRRECLCEGEFIWACGPGCECFHHAVRLQ